MAGCVTEDCQDAPVSVGGITGVTEATVDIALSLVELGFYYSLQKKQADHVDDVVEILKTIGEEGQVYEDLWREKNKEYITHVCDDFPEIDVSGDEEYLAQFNAMLRPEDQKLAHLVIGEDNIGLKCRDNDLEARRNIQERNSGYLSGLQARHNIEDQYYIDKFSEKLQAIVMSKTSALAGIQSILSNANKSKGNLSVALNQSLSGVFLTGLNAYESSRTPDYRARQEPVRAVKVTGNSSNNSPIRGNSSRNDPSPRTYNYNPSIDGAG